MNLGAVRTTTPVPSVIATPLVSSSPSSDMGECSRIAPIRISPASSQHLLAARSACDSKDAVQGYLGLFEHRESGITTTPRSNQLEPRSEHARCSGITRPDATTSRIVVAASDSGCRQRLKHAFRTSTSSGDGSASTATSDFDEVVNAAGRRSKARQAPLLVCESLKRRSERNDASRAFDALVAAWAFPVLGGMVDASPYGID